MSSGKSSISAVKAVRNAGGVVDHCLAIFTYEMERADKGFTEADCRLVSLTNFSTLVQVASEMGKIKGDEKELVLGWAKDPDGWGRKT